MACQRVCIFTLIAYVCFQKSPQIAWVRACKRTLVAIVSLSTVLNQMLLQIARCVFFRCFFQSACFGGCIISDNSSHFWHLLDFFEMCFLMCLQLACPGGCKVTLTAFVCLFFTVGFRCPWMLPLSLWICQMRPNIACLKGCNTTLAAAIWPFLTMYFFQHLSSNGQSKSMQYCHNHRMNQNFPHLVFWYES